MGAPFLAFFARRGDLDRDAPLRERLPLEFALDLVFLLGMDATPKAQCIDGIAGAAGRLGSRRKKIRSFVNTGSG